MRLAVGGDHAGFRLKAVLVDCLCGDGHEVQDVGCFDETSVDFPDIARRVCAAVLAGDAERGILVCGTGVGAAIASNKVPGIRAAVAHDVYTAHQAVEHDDVNVVCLGAEVVGPTLAIELLRVYLAARFDPAPDFVRRVALLAAMDELRAGLPTTSSTSVATSASAESPRGEARKNVFDRW
jgi:ribose 5-phosphate isomerase B